MSISAWWADSYNEHSAKALQKDKDTRAGRFSNKETSALFYADSLLVLSDLLTTLL